VNPIELRSDNAAGAAPEIVQALSAANTGSALAYGDDRWTAQLGDTVRRVFEHPDASVFPVITGTAANSLALSAMCPPWGAVLCHETAHILQSECGATSMFGGGAQMRGVAGADHLVSAAALEAAFAATRWGDNHHAQPAVLSLTVPSDFGTVYSLDHIGTLTELARSRSMRVHLDGARLANAIVALGCSPADLTWRAGVDVFSLGAMKNGSVSTDAIVCFDPAVASELHYRLKRAGHVASKMRFQSAQLQAYLDNDLWLRLAGAANAAMGRLAGGLTELGLDLVDPPVANMAFVRIEEAVIEQLERSGLLFYRMGPGLVRFVTSFQTTLDEIDEVLARVRLAVRR
jgi:threonine aldolase